MATKLYPTFSTRPYALDLPRVKDPATGVEQTVYDKRNYEGQMRATRKGEGFEPCAICGRGVNLERAVECIVDVQDCTWSKTALRGGVEGEYSDCDMRQSWVGSDCAKRYIVKGTP